MYRYVYTYDNAGNRTSKKTYAYTTGTLGSVTSTETYSYSDESWGDKLTGVNGTTITYDEIGNPLKYEGYVYEWQNGRQLSKLSNVTRATVSSYTYNADGIRTSKTVNGVKHTYTLNGSQIVSEEWKVGSTTHTLVYLYDESGLPIGLQYHTSSMANGVFNNYFFEKNMQGDITAIFKENGAKIGAYTYDSWGNVKTTVYSNATTLEKNIVQSYNPFRYREYYYDTESGLYYLQSRYYNPEWGRFLNADGYVSTGTGMIGHNMYAYCNNNPVMGYDPNGNMIIHNPRMFATIDLFMNFLYGDGKDQIFDDNSYMADKFRNNKTMNEICQQCVDNYIRTGKTNYSGSASINGFDELDLWLAIRGCSYEISVSSREYSEGILWWKKTKIEYIVSVKIKDIYDFNRPDETGNGIGSLLNNFGYFLQEKGIGNVYSINITYTKKYNSPYRKKFIFVL